MLPDRVSNPGPLTYESGALPIALRGPAFFTELLIITARDRVTYILSLTPDCLSSLFMSFEIQGNLKG